MKDYITGKVFVFGSQANRNELSHSDIDVGFECEKEVPFRTYLKIKNALGWAAYLFGYEILFRGILLFPLVAEFGVWPAIAVNIALYSSTHIPKGLDETIGAIPLGIVLCVLTLLTGTIWIAFFVHLAMALTNSFTALKHHPEMKSV